jgi:cation diffusion facilitator CzcD-associated flavoprotein CzcO
MSATTTKKPRVVIIGSGPCGMGAAWRLAELEVGKGEYLISHYSVLLVY